MVNSRINVGDILYFRYGKNNSIVSNDNNGVIVICSNLENSCYGKITRIKKIKDNFSIVEAKRVPYDIHDNITYDEFRKSLGIHGYKIGYEIPFYYHLYPEIEQKEILAYNLENGVLIHASTFNTDKNFSFNDIKAYVPSSVHKFAHASGDVYNCQVPLRGGISYENLSSIEYKLNHTKYDKKWHKNSYLMLWNYAESDINLKDYNRRFSKFSSKLWDYTISKLWQVPDEIQEILGDVEELKRVFESNPNRKNNDK